MRLIKEFLLFGNENFLDSFVTNLKHNLEQRKSSNFQKAKKGQQVSHLFDIDMTFIIAWFDFDNFVDSFKGNQKLNQKW